MNDAAEPNLVSAVSLAKAFKFEQIYPDIFVRDETIIFRQQTGNPYFPEEMYVISNQTTHGPYLLPAEVFQELVLLFGAP